MNIKFYKRYGVAKYFVVHHSGGLGHDHYASTQYLTAKHVNNAHKERWAFISSLGYYGGYNFFINQFGELTQFRAIGEETAAQRGFNFNGLAISVCLAGNFNKGVDTPTPAQIKTLTELYKQFSYIPLSGVVPHRHLQATMCYGNSLANNWARNIVMQGVEDERDRIQRMINRIQLMILDIIRQLNAKKFGQLLLDCHETNVRG